MSDYRKPWTFSATPNEVERLDAWARHHKMSRSEAIRTLMRALRLPGQAQLEDFEGAPVAASEAAQAGAQAELELASIGPEHDDDCPEEVRAVWKRSTPFKKSGPCPACWPAGHPDRAELTAFKSQLDREWAGSRSQGLVSQARRPDTRPVWAIWAERFLDRGV